MHTCTMFYVFQYMQLVPGTCVPVLYPRRTSTCTTSTRYKYQLLYQYALGVLVLGVQVFFCPSVFDPIIGFKLERNGNQTGVLNWR